MRTLEERLMGDFTIELREAWERLMDIIQENMSIEMIKH